MWKESLVILFMGLMVLTAQTDDKLLRRAYLGISPSLVEGKIKVEAVSGTAAKLGLKAGDFLTTINGERLDGYEQLQALMAKYRAGEACELRVLRQGKELRFKGYFEPRPYETSPYSEVIYDQAPYKQGQLRVIINKPPKAGKMPALLFVPGYTCSSLDNLDDRNPYKKIINAYVQAGFVVLRIEKSGLGDSYNTPACEDCNLLDEIENFQVGLDKLRSLDYVDGEQIFIYGHSMGGIIAPALSARNKVAGLIVYGTTAKSWFEYQLEMYRTQGLLEGKDPLVYEQEIRDLYETCYRFFIRKEALAEIAKDSQQAALLRQHWLYEPQGNRIFGRNAEYWRQIQDYPHLEHWKNSKAKVLVQFGESDFQAFSLADHQQIVHTVNHYRPKTARLVQYPQTDHFLAKSGTMQDAYDKFAQGRYLELFEAFNPQVAEDAVAWAQEVLQGKTEQAQTGWSWQKLPTEAYPGKQDDIYFINEQKGWYVNGAGKIYRTEDAGQT